MQEYVDYLRAYIKNFNLMERINLQTKVVHVSRDPAGGHIVSYVRRQPVNLEEWETTPQIIHAAYIALCTGLHVVPSMPTMVGIEHVLKPRDSDKLQPAAFHSVDYKSRSQLAGRRVMILGTGEPPFFVHFCINFDQRIVHILHNKGETGMDIAYEAAKAGAKEVVLCSRSGCLSRTS
jgi:dimethylaniline monooxygenase (N-oxide forming)